MINRIQLYAERHTGSKWLTQMIKDSFGIENPWGFGWKHWFFDSKKINETDTSNYLFIFLCRNPYQWIAAMNQTPHHARPKLKGLDLDTFIKEEWECEWTKRDVPWITDEMNFTEMMNERNPDTGERFKNIVELRNYKNREFLSLKEKEHFHIVRYEDMRDNPVKIINKIIMNNPIKPLRPNQPVKKKVYSRELTKESIQFINDNIDWDLEEQLGYKKNIIK